MSARELADELCLRMQKKRLERLGERAPSTRRGSLDGMSREEQQNWIDLANVMLDMNMGITDRLRELIGDWHRYGTVLANPEWRNDMRRAVVAEMREQVERLWKEAGGT